jgi:AbrB family looped-hinge helix DNA binding protein
MNTEHELTIDGAGRIVLPQPIRRQFHLTRGSTLDVEIEPEAIVLRPHTRHAGLTEQGGLLVHEGMAVDDLMSAVAESRRRRDLQVVEQRA